MAGSARGSAPDPGALTDMLAELRTAMSHAEDTQRRILHVTGTAWSADRMVKAVAGPRGQLVDLEIDPRVYRRPNSAALAASILSTVRQAAEQAMEETRQILAEHVPSDMRLGRIGSFDLQSLVHGHDADLAAEEDDDAGLR